VRKGAPAYMAGDDLRAEIESICGLPCPPPGVPNELDLWAQHEVASNFLLEARRGGDPEENRKAAAERTLQNHAHPLHELVPHIERALGRELLQEEIAAGVLYDWARIGSMLRDRPRSNAATGAPRRSL
jgi:hypothetical protein